MLRDEPENGEKETGESRFPVFVSREALKWDGIVGILYRGCGFTLAPVMPGSGSTAPNTGCACSAPRRLQAVLQPYLDRIAKTPERYCFSPRESEEQRNEQRRQERQSQMTPSQKARKRSANAKRPPRDR